jgi:hypothetical protein
MRTHLVIAALAFAATLAAGQELPSYVIAGDAPPTAARTVAERAYGRLPLIFSRGPTPRMAANSGSVARGAKASRSTDRALCLHRRTAADEASIAQRTFTFVDASAHARIEALDPQPARVHHIGPTSACAVKLTSRLSPAFVWRTCTQGSTSRSTARAGASNTTSSSRRARILARSRCAQRDPGRNSTTTALCWSVRAAVRLHRPIAYQLDGDTRTPVDSSFAIDANGDVRFRVGAYDPTRMLVIDPVVSYATYLGGNGFEQGMAIAVDGAGNAYVAGYTLSSDFPTVSAYDRSLGKSGDVDVFVTKLNAAGTGLVWSTYIGGAGSIDRAVGIASMRTAAPT